MEFYFKFEENEINNIFECIDFLKEKALNEKNEYCLKLLNNYEKNLKKIYITK